VAAAPLSVVRTPSDLSADWLADVLAAAGGGARIEAFSVESIGTGQMSQTYRVRLTWVGDAASSAPASVVLKLAAEDEMSRNTGVGIGLYEREVRFYQEVAPRLGEPVVPCHLAELDPASGFFTLLLQDAMPAEQGDQIAGCTVAEVLMAARGLARLHAPVWEEPALERAPWLNQPEILTQPLIESLLPSFLERYSEGVADEHRALVERFVPRLDAWLAVRPRPWSLVHADYRLDNLLFGRPGSPQALSVVDWQTVGWGPPLLDAAYLVAGSLTPELRRAHEQDVLRAYHAELRAAGVDGFPWEACWLEYRRTAFHGVLMAVVASMMVERTPRGDHMFMTMLARHAQQVLELRAEELIGAV
jgi:hypothetical protein